MLRRQLLGLALAVIAGPLPVPASAQVAEQPIRIIMPPRSADDLIVKT